MSDKRRVRVLYSFPHKLGAGRICNTAWQQVNGLAEAGAELLVFPGVLHRALPEGVSVKSTLSRWRLRIPYKLVGSVNACALHDHIVARRLEKLKDEVDIVHTWPLGALKTLETASRLGIPTTLERPNAHTAYAYEVVRKECERIGVELPPDHEHAFKPEVLEKEEEEYRRADTLLCPSDFVARTFVDKGFAPEKLVRHQYGYDEKRFFPGQQDAAPGRGLTMLSVGVCAVRKGLHFALEAWLASPAHKDGTFLIAGEFVPSYYEKLKPLLEHPSVKVLGHRDDVPELMRGSDVLVLPSIEEGSALATSEARGSGCVLLVSDASGAVCEHMVNAMVHPAGDVSALTEHLTALNADRELLKRLREASLSDIDSITWKAAGVRLLRAYEEIIDMRSRKSI